MVKYGDGTDGRTPTRIMITPRFMEAWQWPSANQRRLASGRDQDNRSLALTFRCVL